MGVLISFREWLHSYKIPITDSEFTRNYCSHLFQRVASFLQQCSRLAGRASGWSSHLFQRVASFLPVATAKNPEGQTTVVLISFREWLHSYPEYADSPENLICCSHLFQRVASFLQISVQWWRQLQLPLFSSLSESGFIPTTIHIRWGWRLHYQVLISFREWLHSYI